MKATRAWRSVPADGIEAWRRAFAEPTVGHALRAPCPVCGAFALHRYFGQGTALKAARTGFVARGALWEWCSSCRSFEHASALIPDGWVGDLVVEEDALTAEPGALQDAVERTETQRRT